MVINTKLKFVFVHIPKAAGTSVMNTLKPLDGDNHRWLAKTKYETLAELHSNIKSRRSVLDKFTGRCPRAFFTFGFVRNPWDRMASFYRFLTERRPRSEIDTVSNFADFLTQARDGVEWIQTLYSMKSQLDYFTFEHNRMQLGFLGHYEYLEDDFNSITQTLRCPVQLPHFNQSSNSANDYRTSYDDDTIELVADLFAEEISFFGYEFANPRPKRRLSCKIDCERPRTMP